MNYPLTFGKYLLLERINVGGMAEVFKAKAFGVEGFERILAIKRILPNMADDDEFINMFVDEARIAVQLSHANIVQIYELGKFENQYYIAMEYVSGKDLRHILDGYRKENALLPLPAAAYVACRVCDGLDYAHRKADPTGRPLNVIHRDVSPQNMLISYEGAVKITDFGIAKAEDRASKTQAGVLKGKFGYMSPEQVRGLEIDHRSDIFAVGILLYEMITGKRLFLGESDFSTLEKVRNAEVVPPTQLNPEVPPELERVMLKALAKERDERYQWTSELADDLQQFLIENNTIYNSKRLAALLQERYRADIGAEMLRMEEYMRMAPPSSPEALAGADEMRGAPVVRTDPGDGERTMIFESGFVDHSSAPTNAEMPNGAQSAVRKPEPRTGSIVAPKGTIAGVVPSRISPVPSAGGGMPQKHLGAIIIAVAAFLSLLILLLVLLLMPTTDFGTIVVTSTPQDVEIYLDGNLVANKTPLTKSDIPVGPHLLHVKAAGYTEKAYKFELVAGSPAVIPVQLDRTVPERVLDGKVEIVSDPDGAAVRIAGQYRGTTPLTITGLDTTQPIVAELSKDGFHSRMVTVTFPTGQKSVRQPVELARIKPAGAAATCRVMVFSNPVGATVYIGRQKVGVTPIELTGVPCEPCEVELARDGFKPLRERVTFDSTLLATVKADLEPLARRPGKEKRKGGGGGGGGGCSGNDGKVSVMAQGEMDCRVSVGKADLGSTPLFNKPAPTGHCEIKVTCPSGKSYREVRDIDAGTPQKVIVKPEQWR